MGAVLLLGILYMNKKFLHKLIYVFFAFSLLFTFTSCTKTYFYNYIGIWSCDELTIESFGDVSDPSPQGTLILDGKEYVLEIVSRENESSFYDKTTIDLSGGGLHGSVIWKVRTELKKDKLYVRVYKDYISDCTGKTYVLQKQ